MAVALKPSRVERSGSCSDGVPGMDGSYHAAAVACLPGDPRRILILMGASHSHADAVQSLPDQFRRHPTVFYARLKPAPPYHSVEKAIRHLTTALHAMAPRH